MGPELVSSIKRKKEQKFISDSLTISSFPKNQYYRVDCIECTKSSKISLALENGYGFLYSVYGSYKIRSANKSILAAQKGQPVFLPAKSLPCELELQENSSIFALFPSGAEVFWSD